MAAAWKGHTIMPSVSWKMGYDLYKETDRERCDLEVTRRKPFLLVLAFPCMVTTTAPVVGIGTYGGDQTSSAAEAAERQEEGEKACAVRCEEG